MVVSSPLLPHFVLLFVFVVVLLADEVPVALTQSDTNTFNAVNETDGLNPQFVNVDHELEVPQGQEGPIPSYALPQADKDPNITGIATLSTLILFFFMIKFLELSVTSPSTLSPALTCSHFLSCLSTKGCGCCQGIGNEGWRQFEL